MTSIGYIILGGLGDSDCDVMVSAGDGGPAGRRNVAYRFNLLRHIGNISTIRGNDQANAAPLQAGPRDLTHARHAGRATYARPSSPAPAPGRVRMCLRRKSTAHWIRKPAAETLTLHCQ